MLFGLHLHNLKPLYKPDDPPADPPAKPPTGTPPEKKDDGKEFTPEQQKVIDAIIADRLTRADTATTNKLLEQFGVKTVDELKAKLKEADDLKTAQLSELDKAKKQAADAQAALDQAKADAIAATDKANETLMKAAVIAEASSFHDPNDAWLYVDRAKVTVTDGVVAGAKEAVAEVVKNRAHLVKPESERKGTPGSKGKGTSNNKQPVYPKSRY